MPVVLFVFKTFLFVFGALEPTYSKRYVYTKRGIGCVFDMNLFRLHLVI